MKKKILTLVALLAFAPGIAMAQSTAYFDTLVGQVGNTLNSLVPVLIAAAIVYFLWGVLQFVASGDDEEKRKMGRSRMIHGIIAIFVMVSIWGLVGFLGNVIGLPTTGPFVPPPVPLI